MIIPSSANGFASGLMTVGCTVYAYNPVSDRFDIALGVRQAAPAGEFPAGSGNYSKGIYVPDGTTGKVSLSWDSGEATPQFFSEVVTLPDAMPAIVLAPPGLSSALTSTRQGLIAECQARLGELDGTPGSRDPITWDSLLTQTTAELARAARCYYAEMTTPIVSGQARYCAPDLFRLDRALATLADGTTKPLEFLTAEFFDGWGGDAWRETPQAGDPQYALTQGLNAVALYPVPNYAGTLTMQGLGVPAWPNPTDPNPFPGHDEAVVVGACLKRCLQFPTPDNQARASYFRDQFRYLKGKLEQEAVHYTEATEGRNRFRSNAGPGWLG